MRKGSKHTQESKLKTSLSKKGQPSPNKGKKFSEEHRKNLSEAHKGIFLGEKSPCYRGGYARKLWHNNQRRIKKITNGGSFTFDEWETLKAQYNWTCPSCKRKEPEIKLSIDHIIPLSKGGSDNIENIQPLCKSCNCKKHAKIIRY